MAGRYDKYSSVFQWLVVLALVVTPLTCHGAIIMRIDVFQEQRPDSCVPVCLLDCIPSKASEQVTHTLPQLLPYSIYITTKVSYFYWGFFTRCNITKAEEAVIYPNHLPQPSVFSLKLSASQRELRSSSS